jgi:N-acetyl-alpha-D-muramate 1-phosphate uridylyltransferase
VTDDLPAGVVLAAGAGTRLRPLTYLRPKALCPVGNVALLDLALERVVPVVDAVAVNAHHHLDQLRAHLDGHRLGAIHLSVEEDEALETAGALGLLRDWIDGRDVLTANADAWHQQELAGFVSGWDRERVRLMCLHDPANGDFGELRYTGTALLPWHLVRELPAERHGLYRSVIAPAEAEGRLDLVTGDPRYFDCGTPREYLDANLHAAGDGSIIASGATITGTVHNSVVGDGAEVAGRLDRSVIWAGARVRADEDLREAIRATEGVTVEVG